MEKISVEILEELGLTKNEGKVYQTLIEFGALGAGEISAKSMVPYGKIYNVLENLIHKGIVSIIPEKTKKFSATSPETFVKLIEDKERKMSDAKEKIKELKKFYDVKEKNPVSVSVGVKGFYKTIQEMKSTEKYCYNIKWTAEVRDDWMRDKKQKIKEGKEFKEMVRYDSETEKNVKEWLKVNKNIKKIENDGVALSISDDEEVMVALIKSNVTMLIKDKPFARLMKKMFLETYNSAEGIK